MLRLLEDEFPDVYRFSTVVYPSEDDDVITSPYNSVLAMRQLTDGADCVIPIENQVCLDSMLVFFVLCKTIIQMPFQTLKIF